MKPQKKAVVARKSAAAPNTAKKRRASPEKLTSDPPKRDKKTEDKKGKRVEVVQGLSSARKSDKSEDPRKKVEKLEDKRKIEKVDERKKTEKIEERKKLDNKVEERKRIASDKPEEKRNGLLEKIEELKRSEELRKKIEKQDEKKKPNKDNDKKQEKLDKVDVDFTKRAAVEEEKFEPRDNGEKKKTQPEESGKTICSVQRTDEKIAEDSPEKLEKKKKDSKPGKKTERKKSPEKENGSGGKKSSPSTKGRKETKQAKQPRKKPPVKRTILAKKIASRSPPVSKKLIQTKIKLVKKSSDEESKNVEEPAEDGAKKCSTKKKCPPAGVKAKVNDKKPQLAKQMKPKVAPRKYNPKTAAAGLSKKEEKMIKLAEKIVAKKKTAGLTQCELNTKEDNCLNGKTPSDELDSKNIKRELVDSNEDYVPWNKSTDGKKSGKNICRTKVVSKKLASNKRAANKASKARAENSDRNSNTSDEVTLEDLLKQSKPAEETLKSLAAGQSKEENIAEGGSLGIDFKVEADNNKDDSSISATSDGEDDDEHDGDGDEDNEDQDEEEEVGTVKSKKRNLKKRDRKSPSSDSSSERARRMRLFGFWSGPKRHRVASLNALAKVHCLYENEAGGVYLGGYCKPKPAKDVQPKKAKEDKDKDAKEKAEVKDKEKEEAKEREKKVETKLKVEEISPKRKLRNVPGLRGKHWDMAESSSSSSSSDEEQRASEERKNMENSRKKVATKRRKKNEEVMDLKDMVVCKRMASLNASAILAASYSDEKYHCRGSSSSDSSSDSEVEVVRRRKQSESEAEKRKSKQGSDPEEVIKQPNKVVILNQDTDVTITGVYVNQTRSTHHEGFCSIAGMQYRISSTSHTQTAATAVATEILEHPKPEQPCKSYTPLGALSSMQPPGSQGPPHPPMSPRRHSAFSAPHQHGYYQPAGPLIQHPPTLPPVKAPPPEPTPTPPQNSEGSDDLVAASTTSGGTASGGPGGGSFYRAYCPQYYSTPPQYQELCYPPTYSHPHAHPPPYYKYAPTYRRQYYGYQESTGPGGGGPGGGGGGGGPGVVEYQPPPPPPAEYPPPPYYGGYPPPPPPPPPPGNPAYMHPQGRPFVDHAAFQGCPCPMQSCPKNVDTGPLIGNGKGAPVGSGPGLSLPPSALVGPPSPARGLAGLAPHHGAIAWDTDRVQINNHRNITLNQPPPPSQHNNSNGGHNNTKNEDCRTKDEKSCQNNKMSKCNCQKHACTSTCEVKTETLSPNEKLATTVRCNNDKLPNFKVENNNVKCESCSDEVSEKIPCEANCNVKCESGYKCEILECEQCVKGQMAILDIDKDSGILLIDDKLEGDGVKEELNDVVLIDNENWKKPDYESTVPSETVEEKEIAEKSIDSDEQPKCQKVTKRKLSLDSLSDNKKKRKINKRTLSVGSVRDLANSDQSSKLSLPSDTVVQLIENVPHVNVPKKKYTKKEAQNNKKRKLESLSICEPAIKKSKTSKLPTNVSISSVKQNASETSIMDTITSVIEESLQITKKNEQKFKISEINEKKKAVNLLSTMKRVAKKTNSHKTVPSKISVSKVTELKNGQSKTQCEATTVRPQESKLKLQDAKSKTKVKTKILNAKSKIEDAKSKIQDPKLTSETCKQSETISNAKVSEGINGISNRTDIRKPTLIKNRRKSTKKQINKKACLKSEETLAAEENLALIRRPSLKPKWSNGWSWEGEPYEAKVYLTNEESAFRRCYASMRHISGDVLKPRDCVLLKSGLRKADLPFVAKIAALWENPHDGEMMFSLLWYYRPEHTEQGRTQYDTEDEVFASRHRDANSVACIEDKCYVLTFNEYCRYRKDLRRVEEGLESPGLIVPPGDQSYPRVSRLPPIPVPAEIVLFCRRVYDYRGKKLVKNPG